MTSGSTLLINSSLAIYTLTANVERLRILSTGAANGTGNSLDNTLYAGSGDNVLNGGAGSDTVSYAYGASGSSGVTVSLATSAAQVTGGSGSDTLLSIEHLIGSANADRLTGNSGANRLDGGADNDTLAGGLGNDTLLGGTGLERIRLDRASEAKPRSEPFVGRARGTLTEPHRKYVFGKWPGGSFCRADGRLKAPRMPAAAAGDG